MNKIIIKRNNFHLKNNKTKIIKATQKIYKITNKNLSFSLLVVIGNSKWNFKIIKL